MNSENPVFQKKTFYKTALLIGLPVVAQNLMTSVLNMIDTVMIGSLGEFEVASVAIANRLVQFFMMVMFGLSSGFSVFTAQYYGAGDYKKIHKVMGFNLTLVTALSLVFSIVFYLFAPRLIGLFVQDTPEVNAYVIGLGAEYLRIIVFCLFFNGVSYSLGMMCRSVRQPLVPMLAALVGIACNTGLNYIFIFGKLGLPAMGVAGAAYATVIARLVEFAIIGTFVFFRKRDNALHTKFREMFGWSGTFIKNLIKTSLPVIINETTWSLAQTYYVALVGVLGAVSVAVIQITSTVNTIFGAIFMGAGSACAILVGNEIGRGRMDLVREYARRFIHIFIVMSAAASALMILCRKFIMSLFTLQEGTAGLLDKSMIVSALSMVFMMMTYVFIIGLFRSGGDTKFCMFLEMGTLWLVGIPAAYIGIHIYHVPVYVAAALLQLDNVVKLTICILRYRSFKWLNRVIDSPPEGT